MPHMPARFSASIALAMFCAIALPGTSSVSAGGGGGTLTAPLIMDDGAGTPSSTQLHASWLFPNASNITEYRYEIRQDSASGTIITKWASTGAATSVTRTGLALTYGKTYFFAVRGKDRTTGWSVPAYSDGIRVNRPPTAAVSGPSGKVDGGVEIRLDATGSRDPDGDTLRYSWRQVSGPSVSLSAPASPTTTFESPFIRPGDALQFQVAVSDGIASATGSLNVTVAEAPLPSVDLQVSATTVQVGQPFTLTTIGNATVGIQAVWWYGIDTGITDANVVLNYPASPTSTEIFTTPVVNPTKLDRAFGSPRFSISPRVTSYTFTSDVTINQPGVFRFGANSRDVMEGQPADATGHPTVTVTVTNDPALPTPPGQPTEGSPDQDTDTDGYYTVYWTPASDPTGILLYELNEEINGAWIATYLVGDATSYPISGNPNGTYRYRVRAMNNAEVFGPYSAVSDGITVGIPPTITNIGVSGVTSNGATISWTTNIPSTSQVDYGTTASYGQTTPLDSALVTFHSVSLTGLSAMTTHHFRVRSAYAGGSLMSQSGDNTLFTANPGPSIVSVSGRQLLVRKRNLNGTLAPQVVYTIRGVDYSPASRATNTSNTDPNNANIRRLEFGTWYPTDIPLLKAMKVNTVRLFIDPGFDNSLGPVGRLMLDEFYRNDIMVIMTVDDAINNTTRAQQVVNYYKDHPAILMWSLGSEWNINRYFGVASSVLNAAQRTQTAAALIEPLDANHPLATSYGEIDINATGLRLADTQNYVNNICPSVDIWSLNIYRPKGLTFRDLFNQWISISTKPMFLGEFGVDAFHATSLTNPNPPGAVNEAEQAQWDVELWDDIVRNLSAVNPAKAALGGTVFAWNDEWWKVQFTAGSQESGGWFSGGFPDGMGNEEYFGIVDIDRATRQVHGALTAAFDPAYVPPPITMSFSAFSAGWSFGNIASFSRDGGSFYSKFGGGGGGRGFNVAVIDPGTGAIIDAGRNFDTYITRHTGTDMNNMIAYLNGIPNGRLVLLAVADDSGLNQENSCIKLPYAWTESGMQALEALGSTQIRNVCFRHSWAMVTVKGAGPARDEQRSGTAAVTAQTSLNIP